MFEYFCDFKPDHILVNAKLLPCGSTACQKCIAKIEKKKKRKIFCPFCKGEHQTNDLPSNLKVDFLIKKNIVSITENIVGNFHDLLLNCQGRTQLKSKFYLITFYFI